MSPKYRRQNRNVCDLVLIFSQNQVLFFIEVQLYMSFESRPYSASHKTSSTRSFRNNIQWWEILPYSDKEITLKTFVKLRLQPQKRIVLILLTAVDLHRSIMCAAWPDNICLESTSLPPKGFQEVLLISITIFISSYLHFFLQIQVFRRSLSLSIKIIDQVLRDKKKEPAMFWSANFPPLPR